MNKARVPNEFAFKMDLAGKVYGSAFVMRMKTEVAALSQVNSILAFNSSAIIGGDFAGNTHSVPWVRGLRKEEYLHCKATSPSSSPSLSYSNLFDSM